jgi:dephospho-CoA kinase
VSAEWVFGYGSLAADGRDGHPATLRGHRRRWGVAMDNSRDLPGYKWYRQRATGTRPAVFVAFLDLVADAGGGLVNGLCLPVDATLLELLDARERNYVRVDVTAAVEAPRGRVWAYVGSDAGRERLSRGLRERRLVVSQEYLDDVEHGFRRLGAGQLDAYRASTEPLPPGCEALSLERIDLPG